MINLLYIDLFCGAGGTSTGVSTARLDGEECAKVIACVNHDAGAIASHAANHPEPMTAGELRKKIKNLPSDTPVYIVVDKISDDAWDEEKGQWRYAIPLVYAERERIYSDDGDEMNLLLEYENL